MEARLLGEADRAAVEALVAGDPLGSVYVASRVDAGVLVPHLPGDLYGYPARDPYALLHVGANMVPFHTDAAARQAFADKIGRRRWCVSIVGPQTEALPLWRLLADRWPDAYASPREIRHAQPLMVQQGPARGASDPRVRRVGMEDVESYFRAACAMYLEELGTDPLETNPRGYRQHVEALIKGGFAYGIVERGRVLFKADVGAHARGVAQIQGVWLDPALRGRGLAAPAMASVVNALLAQGMIPTLYVNDFNVRAIATYRRVGFEQIDTLATVLY